MARARATAQLAHHLHHLEAGAFIEVAGRFVGENQRWLLRQGAGDGGALLLAAGELGGKLVELALHADGGQVVDAPSPDLWGLERQDLERGLDVFERRERREEVVELEDEADLGGAKLRPRAFGHGRDALAVHHDAAGRRDVEGADQVQERRLATPRDAEHDHELVTRDPEVHVAQDVCDDFTRPVALCDPIYVYQDALGGGCRRISHARRPSRRTHARSHSLAYINPHTSPAS